MSLDERLLRETLELALAGEGFPARFYEVLFSAHPEVRPMFHRNSAGAQQKMFAQKLCAIVDSAHEPERMAAEIRATAASHRVYGVRDEMYDWVGEALIVTLREACGSQWTPEAEKAWRDAYGLIVAAMTTP